MPYSNDSLDQLSVNLLLDDAAREQNPNTLYQYQQSQRLQLPRHSQTSQQPQQLQQSQQSPQPQQSQHSKLSGAQKKVGDIDQKQTLLYIVQEVRCFPCMWDVRCRAYKETPLKTSNNK